MPEKLLIDRDVLERVLHHIEGGNRFTAGLELRRAIENSLQASPAPAREDESDRATLSHGASER